MRVASPGSGPVRGLWVPRQCLPVACLGGWALHAAPALSPHAGPAGLSQLLAQPWFCSLHKSVLVASAHPPALPGRVRNPLFLEMKPPASQTPARVPSCQPSCTCSSCLCALLSACPSPAHGALRVPPAHTDLLLAQALVGVDPERALWFSSLFPGARRSRLERFTVWWEEGTEPWGRSRPPGTAGDCLTEALKRPFPCSVYRLPLGAVKHLRSRGRQAAVRA